MVNKLWLVNKWYNIIFAKYKLIKIIYKTSKRFLRFTDCPELQYIMRIRSLAGSKFDWSERVE